MALHSWQKTFQQAVARHRREGLGWRYDGLASWSTEKIFDQLRELGIEIDAAIFHDQAVEARKFKTIEDLWLDQLNDDKKQTLWEDFPLLAVPILWDRLAGEVACANLIEHRLYQSTYAEERGEPLAPVAGVPAIVVAAMEMVRYLQSFPVEQRSSKYDEIVAGSYYDYSTCLIELVEEHAADFPDLFVQLADVITDENCTREIHSELAIALVRAGWRDEAISRAKANIQRFPDDVWIRILAGDVFDELKEDAEAVRIWLEALPLMQDPDNADAIIDRLKLPLERQGRTDEWDALRRAYPLPTQQPPPAPPKIEWEPPPTPEPIIAAAKVGRNDPCPCGSGKKYKKCCLP